MANVKALSRQRSIYLGLFSGIFLPAILLRIFEYDFDMQFLTKLSIFATIAIPSITVIAFITLLFHYKCPYCSALWSYLEVEDHLMNYTNKYYKVPYTKSNFVYRTEEHIVERSCTNCSQGKTSRKSKRIIERE